jgi:hypothetical protein
VPGFSADCLETLEEISIVSPGAFLAAGGKEFHYIPCLNDQHEWIAALAQIAMRPLQGWPVGVNARSRRGPAAAQTGRCNSVPNADGRRSARQVALGRAFFQDAQLGHGRDRQGRINVTGQPASRHVRCMSATRSSCARG